MLSTAIGAAPAMGEEAVSFAAVEDFDAAAFEAYVDGVVEPMMEENRAVGMTLSVVRDGEILLAKGYGLADREAGEAVDPEKHLFRIGSISKTFTGTAIMQLVEEGRIDIDAPVNDYLVDFKLPDAFERQVTVRDLLTHRGGFETLANFSYAGDAAEYRPLRVWLPESMPTRVRPPGAVTNYSNWSYGLLGRVVEAVSGMPYEEYFERRIFTPLGMTSTTARQPLRPDDPLSMDPALFERHAKIYLQDGDGHKLWRYELLLPGPAGAVSSTALDMTRYMTAHVSDGDLDGARILKEPSARAMRRPLYPGRASADYAYGFYTQEIGQYTAVRHDGGIGNSKSTLVIVPARGLGFFSSQTGASTASAQFDAGAEILRALIGDVIDAPAPALPLSTAAARQFEGRYVSAGRNETTARALFSLAGAPTVVAAGPESSDAERTLRFRRGDKEDVYVRIADAAFRHVESGEVFQFTMGEDGRAAHYQGGGGATEMERAGPGDDPQVFAAAAGAAVMLALLRFVGAAAGVYRGAPTLASGASLAASAAVFAVAGFFLLAMRAADALGRDLWHTWPSPMVPQFLASVLVLGAASVVVLLGMPAIIGRGSLLARAHYCLFAVSLIVLMALFQAWSLIGFRY